MRTKLLIGGLIAAIAAPALAQPPAPARAPAPAPSYDAHCRRENQKGEQTSTVVGGLGGALVGSAIAGKKNRALGAVIGGIGGAVVGNQVAKAGEQPCPPGYVYDSARPAAYAPPPPPPPAYGPPPRQGDFWYGAPDDLGRRFDFLQERINRARFDHRIDGREARQLSGDLAGLRRQERRARYRGHGELAPQDRDFIFGRLEELSHRLHWQAEGGDHYDRHDRDDRRDRDDRH